MEIEEEEEEEEETAWLGDSSLQSVRSPPFSPALRKRFISSSPCVLCRSSQ